MGGFSLLEMMAVVAIALVVMALALPNLVGVVATASLRGGLGDLATLMQQCRMQSVQRNKYKFVHMETTGGRLVAYIDDGANSVGLTSMSQQIYLPRSMSWVAAPNGGGAGSPTALTDVSCGGSSTAPLCSGTSSCDVYFTPMGIPASCTTIANCTPQTAFVYYFNYAGSLGATTWAALCVSPAGRLKSWYWTGSSWGN